MSFVVPDLGLRGLRRKVVGRGGLPGGVVEVMSIQYERWSGRFWGWIYIEGLFVLETSCWLW